MNTKDRGRIQVSPDRSHHLFESKPFYENRFKHVLRYSANLLAAVLDSSGAYHIDITGAPVYTSRFLQTFGFYGGLASVRDKTGWFHITADGNPAYSQRFSWCGNFQEGLCVVRNDAGSYFHITPTGEAIYKDRWRYAGDYRDGHAVVQAADGLSTHIDLNGKLIHSRWFIDLDIFHKGFARARDDGGWMHIDIKGQPIYTQRFNAVEPFYNGQARVERFDGALEIIDEDGSPILELRPPRTDEFMALSGDIVGFWRSYAIAAAIRLGVFDALPCTDAKIDAICGLKTGLGRRLLRALGELGLVVRHNGVFEASDRGMILRAEHPVSLREAALEFVEFLLPKWQNLEKSLIADSEWLSPRIFDEVSIDEFRTQNSTRMLASYAVHDYANVPEALGLSGSEMVIDAGGGSGVLSEMLLNEYPGIRMQLLERPEVVRLCCVSVKHRNRFSVRSIDLFEPWGIVGDVIVLARVLHDWDDEAALKILVRAREAMSNAGKIAIVDIVMEEDDFRGGLCDLHMHIVSGGRERSINDFRMLLNKAGFKLKLLKDIKSIPSLIIGEPT